MATQIQLTRSGTAAAIPAAAEMELGEVALNYADGKLFFKNLAGQIEQLNSTYNNSGKTIFVNDVTDRVGLNTITPNFLLDLGGDSASTANTLRLNQNNNGTAIRIGGSASGDITLLRVDNLDGITDSAAEGFSIKYLGSNSNNELAVFTDNQSGSAIQALTILQNGNIGIGVATPAHELDVAGTIKVTDSTNFITLNNGSEDMGFILNNGGKLAINAGGTTDVLQLQTNGGTRVHIDNVGNVGIGTTAPYSTLTVKGVEGSDTASFTLENSGGARVHQYYSGSANTDDFYITRSGTGGSEITLQSDGDLILNGTNGDNVGIGTTTPSEALDVVGNISATGTATAATPTLSTHLTTKAYVDNSIKHGSTPTYSGNQGVTGRTNFSFGMPLQHQGCHMNRSIVYNVSPSTPYPVTFIDALDVKITPRDVNSGIMIQSMLHGEGNSADENMVFDIHRKIGSGSFTKLGIRTDADSNDLIGVRLVGLVANPYDKDQKSTMNNVVLQYVDEPQTAEEVTYSISVRSSNSTTWTLNSVNYAATNDDAYERATSNVVLTELAGIGT